MNLAQLIGAVPQGSVTGQLGMPLSAAGPASFGSPSGTGPNVAALLSQLQSQPVSRPNPAPMSLAGNFGGATAQSALDSTKQNLSTFINNATGNGAQAQSNPIFQQYQGLMQSYLGNLQNPGYTESPTDFLKRQAKDDPNSWGFLLNLLNGGSGQPTQPGAPTQGQAPGQQQSPAPMSPVPQGPGGYAAQAQANPIFQKYGGMLSSYLGNLNNPGYNESPTAFLLRQAKDDPASWGFLSQLVGSQP